MFMSVTQGKGHKSKLPFGVHQVAPPWPVRVLPRRGGGVRAWNQIHSIRVGGELLLRGEQGGLV